MDGQTGTPREKIFQLLLPRGIRARLFLLIGLVLLPLSILLIWIFMERQDTRRTLALQTEMEVAQGVAMAFAGYVDSIRRHNYAIGQAILRCDPPVLPKAARLLSVSAAEYPSVRNLSWVDLNGIMVASSQKSLVGSDISSRTYFRELKEGRAWTIGNVTESGIRATSPTIVIANRICNDRGALLGIMVAAVEPDRLGEVALTQHRPGGGVYAIFDHNGTVAYRSTSSPLTWQQRTTWISGDQLLRRTLDTGQPQTGVTRLPVRGKEWVAARVPISSIGWVAGAGTPFESALAPMRRAMLREGAIAFSVFTLAFLLAFAVAQSIAIPLLRLEHDTYGAVEERMPVDSAPLTPAEVSRLRRSIAGMTADIRAASNRFRLALDNIPDVVVIYDSDFRIRYINPATLRTTGLTAAHFLGKKEEELFPDQFMLWRPLLAEAFESGTVQKQKIDFTSSQGVRNLVITCVPLVDEQGRVQEVMGITHDYTERKYAEDGLKDTLEELKRSNRELEQFAYVASHDLQEPLRMVASFVQLIQKRYRGRLDEKADTYINFAVEGAKRMQDLIEDLLAFSRLSRNADFRRVDMNLIVDQAIKKLASSIRETGAEVTRGELPEIVADERQMLQLVYNLIGNGIAYRNKEVPAWVRVTAAEQDHEWHFTVSDNGIGIEPQYFERIFLIFQRLHTRDEYSGTGMGLPLCKKIVERHHGRIWVESSPGEGSTFHFIIPSVPAPPSERMT